MEDRRFFTRKYPLFFRNENLLAIQFFQGCLQFWDRVNDIQRKKRKKKMLGFSSSVVPVVSGLVYAGVVFSVVNGIVTSQGRYFRVYFRPRQRRRRWQRCSTARSSSGGSGELACCHTIAVDCIWWFLASRRLKKLGVLEISVFLSSALLPHPRAGQLQWFEEKCKSHATIK